MSSNEKLNNIEQSGGFGIDLIATKIRYFSCGIYFNITQRFTYCTFES